MDEEELVTRFRVIKYLPDPHILQCENTEGTIVLADPFTTGAFPTPDSINRAHIGHLMVGHLFELIDDYIDNKTGMLVHYPSTWLLVLENK